MAAQQSRYFDSGNKPLSLFRQAAFLCLLPGFILANGSCLAHSRAESYSRLYLNGDTLDVSYTMPLSQLVQRVPQLLSAAGTLDDRFADEVLGNFKIHSGDILCAQSRPAISSRSQKSIGTSWQVTCPDADSVTVSNHAFFGYLPDHLHISRVKLSTGDIIEKLMVQGDNDWVLLDQQTSPGKVTGSPFIQYLGIGIEHIITGYDHLAFLLAIILVCGQLKLIVWSVTGFTIGHSLTLCMAVLGYASASMQAVEALIGWTIALVAAEIVAVRYAISRRLMFFFGLFAFGLVAFHLLMPQSTSELNLWALSGMIIFSLCYLALSQYSKIDPVIIKPSLTLLFGLIHGFGFAASLLAIGLPTGRLAAALFGFNLGVEIGQLILITIFLLLVLALTRLTRLVQHWLLIDGTAAILCGVGLFWFVGRAYS